jgi:hypothetical protein
MDFEYIVYFKYQSTLEGRATAPRKSEDLLECSSKMNYGVKSGNYQDTVAHGIME